jgi:3-hydroxybutyryl-CoA dehydrogenase
MAAIHTVAVIGAGVMGRGIAHAAALAGYRTILEDILPSALRKAGDEIRSALDQAVGVGELSPEQAQAAFARVEYAHSVEEAARQAEFVIEAVPEEMESKIEIFTMRKLGCSRAAMERSQCRKD